LVPIGTSRLRPSLGVKEGSTAQVGLRNSPNSWAGNRLKLLRGTWGRGLWGEGGRSGSYGEESFDFGANSEDVKNSSPYLPDLPHSSQRTAATSPTSNRRSVWKPPRKRPGTFGNSGEPRGKLAGRPGGFSKNEKIHTVFQSFPRGSPEFPKVPAFSGGGWES
jgi:hypothetical protein